MTMINQMELIGDSKVAIADGEVDAISMCQEIAHSYDQDNIDDAFMLVDLDVVFERFLLWKREMPMIEPFYAVKCNTDRVLVRTLAALGAGFDCDGHGREGRKNHLRQSVQDSVVHHPREGEKREHDDIRQCRRVGEDRSSASRCQPFYAVKCNTDRVLVRTLAALGAGFDCASREEIDIVMDMGVRAEKIIYANPCKTRSFITHAKERNVSMMTFDSVEELAKIAHLHPDANFHVGSGCNDPTAFREALTHARHLIELGRGLGFDMNLVDLGGGYPGTLQQTSFEDIAAVIRSAVDEFLPPEFGVRLIAEPGRYESF
ncbi:Pyridoxal-dependent decarboxylase, pyridoxal binding domain protein [Teladorsagia circumcincta]|uniref:ornithine decarboxylase n=1 Tax=Teladorsagia circumcincta TaxID=45464 RepID=A0A2G9UQ82_TELCI|nr:Pyridoxal-dependent decarboxylase, pyridoxal binding domain protein [Teladorsagia circumcincta]